MKNRITIPILLILLVLSTFFRIQYLYIYDRLPLSGDAPGFVEKAAAMKDFYSCSRREPLWILWVKICSGLSRDPKTAMRAGNIAFLQLSAVFLFFIIRRRLKDPHALIGSAFFLFIPYLFFSPLRAHRFEMYICMLLLFTLACSRPGTGPAAGVIAGAIAGMLALVRMESLLITSVAYAWRLSLSRPGWKKGPVLALFFFLPVLTLADPFMYSCLKEKGSPFYPLDKTAGFYSRQDKAVIQKTISEDEALSGKSAGHEASLAGYLTRRGLLYTVRRMTGGYYEAIVHSSVHMMRTPFDMSFLRYVIWAGLVFLLFTKEGLRLLAWGIIYLLPYSFILSTRVAGRPSVDIRFAATLTPLMSFAAAGFSAVTARAAVYAIGLYRKKFSEKRAEQGVDNGSQP
ncbi:MAG: hypothetical protein JXJ19_05420 [Elusimicrobia bacterium]|nr:hypothetical protein [Elusimicrobiota bacterium]